MTNVWKKSNCKHGDVINIIYTMWTNKDDFEYKLKYKRLFQTFSPNITKKCFYRCIALEVQILILSPS